MGKLPEGTHRVITDLNRDDTRVISGNASALAAALERDYMARPPDHEPHHIVPANHIDRNGDCDRGRELLKDCGIKVNEADNGLWLPRTSRSSRGVSVVQSDSASSHDNIHTTLYYAEVVRRLENALEDGGPKRVRKELHAIRWLIVQQKFPH